jgi:heat shock protein HtpX
MLANMAMWAGMFGGRDRDSRGNGIGLLVMAIVAPLAALLIQTAISRSREFMADEGGAKISRQPQALASALKKLHSANMRIPMAANPSTAHLFIVNPLSGGSMLSLFSTHPPVEERIARLQELAQHI